MSIDFGEMHPQDPKYKQLVDGIRIYAYVQYDTTERIGTKYQEVYNFMMENIEPDSEIANDDGTTTQCATAYIETWIDSDAFDFNDVDYTYFDFQWKDGKPVIQF
ncbi:MAG: hypothetical protein COA84_13925 [Robiginitomaculum sp.]|nr:MAG: hypothetical protein COA84_13925 [Robiginitomaculum sp.]